MRATLAALGLAVVAVGTAFADDLVKPGAIIVPFRDFDTDRNVVVAAPPADYAGTCWRITYVRGDKVGFTLIKGVYTPWWDDAKPKHTAFDDETDFTAYGKLPYDLAKGEFSIFKVAAACP